MARPFAALHLRPLAALLLLLACGLVAAGRAVLELQLDEEALQRLDCAALANDTQACAAFQTATLRAAIRQGVDHAGSWKVWGSDEVAEPEYGEGCWVPRRCWDGSRHGQPALPCCQQPSACQLAPGVRPKQLYGAPDAPLLTPLPLLPRCCRLVAPG